MVCAPLDRALCSIEQSNIKWERLYVEYHYSAPIFRMSSTGKPISRTQGDAHDETSEVHSHSRRTSPQGHPPSPHSTSDGSVLIVDWDGPDDPENPRKCGLISFSLSLCVRLTISQFIVGGSDGSGEQPSSCPRSH